MYQAYAQWKLLNAYLFPRAEEHSAYNQDFTVMANEVTQLVSTTFAPWHAASDNGAALRQHAMTVVSTGSSVGTLIMSQPSRYQFRWTADSRTGSTNQHLVVLPGFWKISTEQGRTLDRPQLIVPPVTVRM